MLDRILKDNTTRSQYGGIFSSDGLPSYRFKKPWFFGGFFNTRVHLFNIRVHLPYACMHIVMTYLYCTKYCITNLFYYKTLIHVLVCASNPINLLFHGSSPHIMTISRGNKNRFFKFPILKCFTFSAICCNFLFFLFILPHFMDYGKDLRNK